MSLVGRRMDVAREVGRTKRKDNLDIRDTSREELVVRSAVEKAQTRGVDSETATAIAETLIDAAVRVQSEDFDRYLDDKKAMVVGAGRTGAWTAGFLSNRGAEVSVFDPRAKLEGYPNLQTPAEHAKDADLIIIASPLGVARSDMQLILSSSPRGVIFDVCSVKAHMRDTLMTGVKEGLNVTSAHPMFGPNVATPRGENVLVCGCGCESADEVVKDLYKRAGANVVSVALDEHDKLIAYILGAPHLCTLLFGLVTMRSSFAAHRLADLSGPSFSKLSNLASSISNESRRVYHDIQRFNPESISMLDSMISAIDELKTASLSDNPAAFAGIMDAEKEYFERWPR